MTQVRHLILSITSVFPCIYEEFTSFCFQLSGDGGEGVEVGEGGEGGKGGEGGEGGG